MSTLLIQN